MYASLIAAIIVAAATAACTAFDPPPYAPEQPIPYSHKIHAGDNQIPCEYCHTGARRSVSAVVPSVERCMGCHRLVGLDKPNVQKVHEAYNSGAGIQWVKVHDLPDFVRFNHEPHVQYGVACQECHGAIETQDVVTLPSREPVMGQIPLSMGWCITCHEKKAAADPQLNLTRMKDCLTCHY